RKKAKDEDVPTSGGPRLGSLKGLGGERRRKKRPEGDAPKKEGISWMPLIFLFVILGPAWLPVVIKVCDWIAASDLGIKIGLGTHPRDRLVAFYKQHNPRKLSEVDGLLEKYKGRYEELFEKLELK
ncbi:unnamed protein product, partial [Chrysoparadoxa australica]